MSLLLLFGTSSGPNGPTGSVNFGIAAISIAPLSSGGVN